MPNNTLYVVTCIFNPYRFKSRYKLYKEFAAYIEQSGAKLLTVEIAFNDRDFEVTTEGNPWNLQLRTHYEMWFKENGLNLGFEKLLQLVPDASAIAWIDADIKFSNHNWVSEAVYALHHFCVIQLYSEAHNMSPKHESMWSCPSIMKRFLDRGYHQEPALPLSYSSNGHPGLAWAARRETLDQLGGLIDFCIAGSADTHISNALRGDIHLNMRPGMSAGFKRSLERWQERCDKYVKMNVGYIDGICYHAWHGRSEQRGYSRRWDITNFHKFDPSEDIYKGLNGLYRFTGEKPHLIYDLRKSMMERNEDGTDL